MSETIESVFNLQKAIFDAIEGLGMEEAVKFFGRSATVLSKWQAGSAIPDVGAAQKVLDKAMTGGEVVLPVFEKPPEQGQTIPEPSIQDNMGKPKRTTVEGPKEIDPVKIMSKAKKFSIMMPVGANRPMSYATVLSLLAQWKATLPHEIRDMLATMDMEPDTTCVFSRNRLATRFLERGDEWSFWMDSDMIAPTGNPTWWKRRTGSTRADRFSAMAALEKLTSHGKTFVGSVYTERNANKKITASPGMEPKNEAEKLTAEGIRNKGPEDRLVEVDWVGFGCVAVHRKVFEDVLEKCKGVKATNKGQVHEFFTPWKGGNQGEDMSFCERARQAGHPVYLDLSVHCAHLGLTAFLP